MDKNFGGVIWTNHVLQRLRERGIKQSDAWATWRRPDSSKYNPLKGVWVYQRHFGSTNFEVVAKKNHDGKWIILSVWSKTSGNYKSKKLTLGQMLKNLFFGR